MEKIMIKRTDAAKAFDLPCPKKTGDVGYDLPTVENTLIPAHNQLPVDVPTGIRIKLPEGVWALVINRSSTPRKMGIEIVPGLIDTGYTGELFACSYNRTDQDIVVKAGTRLAQFVLFPAIAPGVDDVEELPETERGESGFGSTDVKK